MGGYDGHPLGQGPRADDGQAHRAVPVAVIDPVAALQRRPCLVGAETLFFRQGDRVFHRGTLCAADGEKRLVPPAIGVQQRKLRLLQPVVTVLKCALQSAVSGFIFQHGYTSCLLLTDSQPHRRYRHISVICALMPRLFLPLYTEFLIKANILQKINKKILGIYVDEWRIIL